MCRHANALEAIVAHEIARGTGSSCGCGCARCGGYSLEAAAPARGGTRSTGGRGAMPRWGGWSRPVTLTQLREWQKTGGKGAPAALRRMLRTGQPQVYRITRAGLDRARPLNIGMVERRKSVADRLDQHSGRTSKGQKQVLKALSKVNPDDVLVQVAQLRGRPSVSLAHVYEGWVQDQERPRIYSRDTRFFDEADI
jgi:hypothetical protein